jgi:molybdate transport system substrate-binding protein
LTMMRKGGWASLLLCYGERESTRKAVSDLSLPADGGHYGAFVQREDGSMNRNGIGLAALTLWAVMSQPIAADTLTIAAAADLKYAMDEIVALFLKGHPGHKIDVVYGSSGKTHAQIQQGAPYDLFFSADISLPQALVAKGLATGPVHPYAVGRLVLWSATQDASRLRLSDLAGMSVRKIAIANPKHAPYGQKAEEALRKVGVWSSVESKIVYGENIAQTAQFAFTGAADVGIVALSLALSPEMAAKGKYSLVPDSLHKPLEQGFVVTNRAKDKKLAAAFSGWMAEKTVRATMTKFGFALPNEAAGK